MRLTSLGHAFWLLTSGELRIAMDPVLGTHHTAGVFEVIPRRTVDADALRPDFVLVSHAHFDHFDVPSLFALAERDRDTVVVTPSALVAETCRALGFRTVRTAAPGTKVALDGGLTIAFTPSIAADPEWGVLAMDASGVAWNLVDTMFRGAAEVRDVVHAVTPERRVDVALAPLQPMREIALATADFVGFEVRDQRRFFESAAAIEARYVVPSASGDAHAAPFEAMNAWVFPVSAERAARQFKAFSPSTSVLAPGLGEAIAIEGSDVGIAQGDVGGTAITLGAPGDPRIFRPIDPAPLIDPNVDGLDPRQIRDRLRRWVREDLGRAIAAEHGGDEGLKEALFSLDIALPEGDRMGFTLDVAGRVTEGCAAEYDVLNAVAGSLLVEVIEGRRSFYEVLLAGALRASVRGCRVGPGVVAPLAVQPMFVYAPIGYENSTARAVRTRTRRLTDRRGP